MLLLIWMVKEKECGCQYVSAGNEIIKRTLKNARKFLRGSCKSSES